MPPDDLFLGSGWSFPPAFDRREAEVQMTSGVEDIHRSLEILLTTALGERVMNPAYGCSLDDTVFETLNTSRLAYIENLIRTAILYHEPRIDAGQIEMHPDQAEGVLRIHVNYTVRASNSRFNFVYPFYLNEPGT